jgi:predicted metal-binding protein
MKRILDELGRLEFFQLKAFDTELLSFSEDVRAMCEMNSCGRYNRSWNCPPAVGSLEELKDACLSYRYGVLFNTVSQLEDSFDFEGMMQASARLCEKLREVDIALKQTDLEYRVFGSGSCYSCEKCSYPDNPCFHPDMLFTPIEACGINVVTLSKEAGLSYVNGANTVTFFGMVLYDRK